MAKTPGGALLHGCQIDRRSGIPLYQQLDTALRGLVLDGTLVPGQKLPSSRELAGDLGVSRITVKSVYEQLVAEGFADAKVGAGTFVAKGLDTWKTEVDPVVPRRKLPEADLPNRARDIMSTRANIRHGETGGFRPGVPALDLFPVKLWNRYMSRAMVDDGRRNLSYGHAQGHPELRRAIGRHLGDARGVQVDPSQIVITSGGQQAFAMLAFVLLNQGDTVWYEDPGHIAGRDILRLAGADVASVPIDEQGMDIAYAIARHRRARLIFTTPSHQQPLGTTMSLTRRLALLGYAQENDAWIVEDDYDSEFRYRGRPLPALGALDTDGRVFYVGTFSKSMFAAIRLGYIVVPSGKTEAFVKARNLLGQGSSAATELALARFMEDGRLVEHIRKMRRAYRSRRDVLLECLARDCADHLDVQPTDAGMHLIAWLKRGLGDYKTHAALLDAGIESLPMSVYADQPIEKQALVLGFTGTSETQIPRLVSRMAKTLASLTPD